MSGLRLSLSRCIHSRSGPASLPHTALPRSLADSYRYRAKSSSIVILCSRSTSLWVCLMSQTQSRAAPMADSKAWLRHKGRLSHCDREWALLRVNRAEHRVVPRDRIDQTLVQTRPSCCILLPRRAVAVERVGVPRVLSQLHACRYAEGGMPPLALTSGITLAQSATQLVEPSIAGVAVGCTVGRRAASISPAHVGRRFVPSPATLQRSRPKKK